MSDDEYVAELTDLATAGWAAHLGRALTGAPAELGEPIWTQTRRDLIRRRKIRATTVPRWVDE